MLYEIVIYYLFSILSGPKQGPIILDGKFFKNSQKKDKHLKKGDINDE